MRFLLNEDRLTTLALYGIHDVFTLVYEAVLQGGRAAKGVSPSSYSGNEGS